MQQLIFSAQSGSHLPINFHSITKLNDQVGDVMQLQSSALRSGIMPQYFIDIFDEILITDENGHDLPDLRAVRSVVRRTLGAMVELDPREHNKQNCKAIVRDYANNIIMTASVNFAIDDEICIEKRDHLVKLN